MLAFSKRNKLPCCIIVAKSYALVQQARQQNPPLLATEGFVSGL